MTEKERAVIPVGLHVLPRPVPWAAPLAGFPSTLPPLIGRERELAMLIALLQQPGTRLLTLTGAGGIGKTRLALAVAAEVVETYEDGAVFVPLGAIRDPALVLPAIARALKVREGPERPLVASLSAALGERSRLLVLDNLEQVSDAALDIAALLQGSPRLTLLVTSRVPLRLASEERYATPPLGLPPPTRVKCAEAIEADAVAFFVERAQHVRPSFQLTANNVADVMAICRRLEGIPLAIELAAAWSHVLSPADLLERLGHRLPMLIGGAADQPRRLQTMRDAIAWSYDLLSPDEQALFRRLSVFCGGFTLDAAEYVGGEGGRFAEGGGFALGRQEGGGPLGLGGEEDERHGGVANDASSSPLSPRERSDPLQAQWATPQSEAPPAVLDLLASLIDASLVHVSMPDRGTPRFSMLETVREFAFEQLLVSGEQTAIARAHADYFLGAAEAAEPHLLGPAEATWQGMLNGELGNLRATLSWALQHDAEVGLRIGGALWAYWACQGLIVEGIKWLSDALTAEGGAPRHRAQALITAAALAVLHGDDITAAPLVAEANALIQDLDDPIMRARVCFMNGAVLMNRGNLAEAERQMSQAVVAYAVATATTDRGFCAYGRAYQGLAAAACGDTDRGVTLYEQALAEIDQMGSRFLAALVLNDFAGLLLELGETERARSVLTEAVRVTMNIEDVTKLSAVWPVGHALSVLAAVDALAGDSPRAALRIGAAEAVMQRLGLLRPPLLQRRVDQTVVRLIAELGEETFQARREAGRSDPTAVIAAIVAADPAGTKAFAVRQERGRAKATGDDVALAEHLPASRAIPLTDPARMLGLTRREQSVLTLVVEGRTDREIAARLFISRRTVSKHVSHILGKLDVETRSAAVARAVRDGLS